MPSPSKSLAGSLQDFPESRSNDFITFEEREVDATQECDAPVAEEGKKGLNDRPQGQNYSITK